MPTRAPRTFAEIVRLPNTPTVAADALAGFFLMSGDGWRRLLTGDEGNLWLSLPPALLGGILLYWGGMVHNDARHADKDRVLEKPRPIPLGRISRESAMFLANALMLGGVAAASLAGVSCSAPAAATKALGALALWTALASRLYNRLSEGRTVDWSYRPPSRGASVAGVFLLASCRAAQAGMGVVVGMLTAGGDRRLLQEFAKPLPWVFLSTVFLYYLAVTGVSVFEEGRGRAGGLRALATLLVVAMIGGPLAVYFSGIHRAAPDVRVRLIVPAAAALFASLALLAGPLLRAWRDGNAHNVGHLVKWSIRASIGFNAAFIFLRGQHNLVPGSIVLALLPLCVLLGWKRRDA